MLTLPHQYILEQYISRYIHKRASEQNIKMIVLLPILNSLPAYLSPQEISVESSVLLEVV